MIFNLGKRFRPSEDSQGPRYVNVEVEVDSPDAELRSVLQRVEKLSEDNLHRIEELERAPSTFERDIDALKVEVARVQFVHSDLARLQRSHRDGMQRVHTMESKVEEVLNTQPQNFRFLPLPSARQNHLPPQLPSQSPVGSSACSSVMCRERFEVIKGKLDAQNDMLGEKTRDLKRLADALKAEHSRASDTEKALAVQVQNFRDENAKLQAKIRDQEAVLFEKTGKMADKCRAQEFELAALRVKCRQLHKEVKMPTSAEARAPAKSQAELQEGGSNPFIINIS